MSNFEIARKTVQFLSVDGVEKANSGHPGTPMALAGIGVELFTNWLRYNPEDPAWPNRDRFVLSCGHASMLIYSLLHLAGYNVTKDDLAAFRQWESKTPGHPEYGHTAGIETTTGPLGQGISTAVGMALGAKMMGARVNTDAATLIDYRVFVLASDGDLMEGVSAEATSLAGHWGLGNLVVLYDDNKITIDGSTELSFSEDVAKRFEALGWHVQSVDGHAADQVRGALEAATKESARPSLIITRTQIGYGSPTKQGTSEIHGAPLGAKETAIAKEACGWPTEPMFYTPPEAYEPFKTHVARQMEAYTKWQKLVGGLTGDQATTWAQFNETQVPEDLYAKLLAEMPLTTSDATRSLGHTAQQIAGKYVPSLIGGSADLVASVKSTIKGGKDVSKGSYAGRNINYGIREHAMGSISNGLALAGFIPYTGTFLIFCEYMKPALRLAALMKQQVVYIYSHDSIFLGEDGPTHQPIEQLASMRLIPNLDVLRPADAMECAATWAHCLTRWDGPCAISLTRQKIPALPRPEGFDPADILRGGYILADATNPDLVIIATGSEVHVAMDAKKLLDAKGRRVRVVSMPCLDAFQREDAQYQLKVLGQGIRRVSIEAGSTALWRGVVGLDGVCIGIDGFGASAPAERLAVEFGLTAESVVARVLA